MSSLVHPLLHLHGLSAYVVVGAICFAEVALFVGFFLPGEIAAVYGGVLASLHQVNIVAIVLVVVACAIGGDLVGYEVGRRFGPVLAAHRPLKGHSGVQRTQSFVRRRGAYGVFFGRFIAVVRALIPGVAGWSGLSWRRFNLANIASGLIWGTGYTLAGYAAGRSYNTLISRAGTASLTLLGVLVVLLIGVKIWHGTHTTSQGAAGMADESRPPGSTIEDPADMIVGDP